MDIKEVLKEGAIEGGLLVFTAGFGFASGCLAGRNAGLPGMLIAGGVLSVTYVAERVLFKLIHYVAIEYEWKFSSYVWATVLTGVALQTAAGVTLFVLGIIDGPGLATWVTVELLRASFNFSVNYYSSGKSFNTSYEEVFSKKSEMYKELFENIKSIFLVDEELNKTKRWFKEFFKLA